MSNDNLQRLVLPNDQHGVIIAGGVCHCYHGEFIACDVCGTSDDDALPKTPCIVGAAGCCGFNVAQACLFCDGTGWKSWRVQIKVDPQPILVPQGFRMMQAGVHGIWCVGGALWCVEKSRPCHPGEFVLAEEWDISLQSISRQDIPFLRRHAHPDYVQDGKEAGVPWFSPETMPLDIPDAVRGRILSVDADFTPFGWVWTIVGVTYG